MNDEENWKLRAMERKRLSHHVNQMNPCILKALSGRHILLIGTTGSGKTYAASYMAQHLDCFIFINTQEEKSASDICQVSLEDPSEIQEALEEGYRGIEYVPSFDKGEARAEVQILREGLFEIGSEMKAQANVLELPMWITVFIDETQVYAPLHTQLDAENFFTRGRGYGIRGAALSRQPQELSKEVVNNAEYELIFLQGHYSEPYFTRFKIPIAEHKEWLDREHHFLLYDKKSITRCLPV